VSGSGISWAICKSAPCPRQITASAPHHSVFYRLDALPATQPTASKHWRQNSTTSDNCKNVNSLDVTNTLKLKCKSINCQNVILYTLIQTYCSILRQEYRSSGEVTHVCPSTLTTTDTFMWATNKHCAFIIDYNILNFTVGKWSSSQLQNSDAIKKSSLAAR